MFFIFFGEKVHGASVDAGRHACPVCHRVTHFNRIVETNYFCVFGIRLLPLEKVANYYQCDECGCPFDDTFTVPAQVPLITVVLAYILVGFDMTSHAQVATEICRKISGFDPDLRALDRDIREFTSGRGQIDDLLRQAAQTVNALGAMQVVQAAFLVTYVCCEIQHEDRLRINRIGTALGVSLQFVQSAIENVREHHYFGVHRLVPSRLA